MGDRGDIPTCISESSMYWIFPASNFDAIWTRERGNFFYLDPIFMKIGPAGPNFTVKIGPGERGNLFNQDPIFMKIGPPGPNFTAKIGPGVSSFFQPRGQFLL